MRKLLILLSGFSLFCFTSYSQSIGVNTDASLPHASAMLDVKSTNKGLLIPRVTLTGTNDAVTVGSPALSLMVYNTATAGGGGTAVTPGFYFWNGTAWERLSTAAGIGGSGSINFIPKFTAATTLGNSAIFESGGNVGIGTTTPESILDIAADNQTGAEGIEMTNSNNVSTASGARMILRRSRGTQAVPTAVLANDQLGSLDFRGYTGLAYTGTKASVEGLAAENWSPTANGTFMRFITTPIGSTILVEKMRILDNGNVGIGTISPFDRLDVAREGSIDLGIHFGWNKMVLTNLHNMGVANNANHSIGSKILFKGYKDAALSAPQNIYSLGTDVFGDVTSTVAKNNFFIRDEYASGSPVRLLIDANGYVGIGTTSPLNQLHLESSNPISDGIRIYNTSVAGDPNIHFATNGVFQFTMGVDNDDADKFQISAGSTLNSSERLTVTNTGNVGIGITSPLHPLHMGSGAHVTAGGVWTNASSREYKENITTLKVDEAIETLNGLEPVKYKYKNDKEENYIGFIAEDVPDLVAEKDRKGLSPMDIVAVLTKVVQQQQKRIEALEAKLSNK